MPGDGIKYLIELDGKTYGAEAVTDALKKVDGAAEGADKKLHKASHHKFDPLTTNILKAEFALHALEKGAEVVWDKVKELGHAVLETIQVAAGEKREKLAFENILGEHAGETLEYLDKWSKLTEFGEDTTKNFGAALLDVGYKGDKFHDAMAAIADVASRSLNPLEGAQEALSSLERMQLTGKVDSRTLKGLKLDSRDVVKGLGEALGMTPKAVKKGLEEGSIPAAVAFNTVLEALEKKTGKRLGESGLAAGREMTAKLTHLKELPEKWMKSMAESPSMSKIEHAFDKALEAFDPDGPKGKRIVEGLENIMGTIGDVLEGIDWDAAGMHIASIATELGTWIEPMSKVVELLGQMVEGFLALPTLGSDIGDWFARKLHPELDQTPTHIREARIKKTKELEDQNEKEFARPEVQAAVARLHPDAAPTAARLPSLRNVQVAGGKGGLHIGGSTAHVQVNVNGKTEATASDIHHAVKRGTEEGMTAAMERAAAAAGVAR